MKAPAEPALPALRLLVRSMLAGSLLLTLAAFDAGGVAAAAESADEHLLMAEIALERGELPVAVREITLAAEASGSSATAERATQLTFATGYDGYALRAARRWVELVPGSPLANETLGRLYLRRHQVDEAARYLARALGSPEPLRDEIYLALAADLAQERKAALVTRVLARLTALDPLAPGLQQALGQAALRSGDYDLAAEAATAASLGDPGWREPRLLALRVRAARGDIDGALALLDELVATDEGAVDLALVAERVRILGDGGRLAEARAVLGELDHLAEGSLLVRRTAAFLALKDDDLPAARQAFLDLAAVEGPAQTEAFYYLGQLAAAEGNRDEARDFLGRIAGGPYLVPSRLALAESLARAGELQQALDGLEEFARLNPLAAFEVREFRTRLLVGADRREEALEAYGQLLAYKPDDADLLLARGTLLEQMGRLQPALSDLARAASLAPDDASIINAYGYTLANRTRRFKEAWPLVRRAWELAPESGAIQDSVGWVLFRMGRREEARSHLEEAFSRIADPEVASHLAEVYWRLGDRAKATDLLRATLVAYPASEPALATAERLLR